MDLQRPWLRLIFLKLRNIISELLYFRMEGKMNSITHSSVNIKLYGKKPQIVVISTKMNWELFSNWYAF